MKILQVAPLIAGFAGDSNQILLIAKELQKRGHEVSIATTDADFFYFDKEKSLRYSTIREKLLSAKNGKTEVMQIPTYVAHCTNHRLGMYCFDAKTLANSLVEKFDVIHICSWYHHLGIVFSNIAYNKNIPFVLSAWGSLQPSARNFKRNQKWLIDYFFTKKMIQHASGFHSVGDQETNTYENFGIDKNKIYKIDHGIDLKNFEIKTHTKIFEKLNFDLENEQYLIFMSRIDRKKGLELLFSSFAKIAKYHPKTFLVIAGSGDENYKLELKTLAKKLNLEKQIKWAGLVSESEKLELLKNAKLFVLTSHSDVHPIAVQDAITMGTPVVVTRICDFPEIEEYKTGFLVAEDVDEIASSIDQILKNSELQEIFSKNSKNLVRDRFELNTKISQYEIMFQKIISKQSNF